MNSTTRQSAHRSTLLNDSATSTTGRILSPAQFRSVSNPHTGLTVSSSAAAEAATQIVLIFLSYHGSGSEELESARGTLWLTLRGLDYAHQDPSVKIISDIDMEFSDRNGEVRTLTTIEPTHSNITHTLKVVLGSLSAQGRCTVILCGHGEEDGGSYYLKLPNNEALLRSEFSQIFQDSIKLETEVLVLCETCLGAHLFDLLIEYEVRNGRFTLIKNQGIDSRIKGTLIVLAGAVGAAQTVDVQHQVTALSVPITYEKVKYTLMSYAMWRYLDESLAHDLESLLLHLHEKFTDFLSKKRITRPQVPRLSSSRPLTEPISLDAFLPASN